jgi:uncharacterized membrane protein
VGAAIKRYLIRGILTIIPIWLTWLVVKFMLRILVDVGRPIIARLAELAGPLSPTLAGWLLQTWVQSLLGIILIIIAIYLLGWLTTKLIGRKIIDSFDSLMDRIPMVKIIYGGAKRLIAAFQTKPGATERVVLINYPSRDMKTVGLVTRTMKDQDTGKELAAVYVPTTPNPTSGYLEIVPVENVVSTNWTVDEAMAFIVSGGAFGPEKMNYEKSAEKKDKNG